MKNILLISGSFTSANFYVMLSVIRSLGDVHIHAISANNEKIGELPLYPDVTYYPVYNRHVSFLNSVKRIRPLLLSKAIDYIFCQSVRRINQYKQFSYEKEIQRRSNVIIRKGKIDAIFTVSLQFYTHRIGMKLNSITGIRWYQFWLDPYSNRSLEESLWRRKAEKIERSFFDAADKIYALPEVFVGNRVIDTYRHKLVSFEIPYLENRNSNTLTNDIVFAGGFIKRLREPEPVLNLLLSALDEIEAGVNFHFYVRNKELYSHYESKSKGRITFHNYVNHEELNRILGEAMMLLNIGNAGSIQMPSKTVEYVSFRKPLLFFYKDRNDASLRYLKNYPDICRICVDDELEDNRKKLIAFLTASHSPISYETLMQYKEFRESTPEYIRSQLVQ